MLVPSVDVDGLTGRDTSVDAFCVSFDRSGGKISQHCRCAGARSVLRCDAGKPDTIFRVRRRDMRRLHAEEVSAVGSSSNIVDGRPGCTLDRWNDM